MRYRRRVVVVTRRTRDRACTSTTLASEMRCNLRGIRAQIRTHRRRDLNLSQSSHGVSGTPTAPSAYCTRKSEGGEWAALAHVGRQCAAAARERLHSHHGVSSRATAGREHDERPQARCCLRRPERRRGFGSGTCANPGGFRTSTARQGRPFIRCLQLGADPGTCCYEVAPHREGGRLTVESQSRTETFSDLCRMRIATLLISCIDDNDK